MSALAKGMQLKSSSRFRKRSTNRTWLIWRNKGRKFANLSMRRKTARPANHDRLRAIVSRSGCKSRMLVYLVKYDDSLKKEAERTDEMKLDGGTASSQCLTSMKARRSLR